MMVHEGFHEGGRLSLHTHTVWWSFFGACSELKLHHVNDVRELISFDIKSTI